VQRRALTRKRLRRRPHALPRVDRAQVHLPPRTVCKRESREVELQLAAARRDRLQGPDVHGDGGRGDAVGARLVVLGLDGRVDEGRIGREGERRLAGFEAEVLGAGLDDR